MLVGPRRAMCDLRTMDLSPEQTPHSRSAIRRVSIRARQCSGWRNGTSYDRCLRGTVYARVRQPHCPAPIPATPARLQDGGRTVDTIDLANHRDILPLMPFDSVVPLTDDAPRCRRCAAVLVVVHLRCDDGALLPIYRCPICRHAGVSGSPVVRRRSSVAPGHATSQSDLPLPRLLLPGPRVHTDD
ncbi:MAG: hypothetical protein QOF73_1749 [Thermomicrobiales bacterium]|nr:hypothetical protein [Thermomicrobiales bacterium]